MLKLQELTFKGVGRFVEEQTINFEKLGNLVQLDGINHNTGGSSGAGKSTVFHALDHLFGLPGRPSTVLKSRLIDEDIFVQGIFDYDGKSLIISRGKKLVIDIDNDVKSGSSKITEEKLDEIIAMPRDLFRKILHKRQKEGGFFLQMTPGQTNDFLTSCLNLGHLKKKIEIPEAKLKELNDKKTANTSALESAKSALKATQDAILALGLPPIRDIHQSVILELKGKMDKSLESHKFVLAQQKRELDDLELMRPQISSTAFDRTTIVALEKQKDSLSETAKKLLQAEKDRQASVKDEMAKQKQTLKTLEAAVAKGNKSSTEITKVAAEIKKIREQLCPTCEQGWATDQAKAKEIELISKIKSLKEDIDAARSAAENISAVKYTIAECEVNLKPQEIPGLEEANNGMISVISILTEERKKETDHQVAETTKNKVALKEFADIQKAVAERLALIKAQSSGQVDIDSRTFEAAVAKLRAYEDARVRHEKSLANLMAQEEKYSLSVSELTKTSIQVHNELIVAEEIKKALKSFLSCSFDDALQTIGENATKLIRSIPNMANATIQLEGIRETQDGKIKEEVNAVIHMDGEENVDIRSLCGGERTSTDLAIDLSVIELIENRTNKGIDLFILDEPFDGLDTVCIEMALEVLKSSSTNKRLVIVDHNPVTKEQIGSGIVVERTGETSRVVQR